MDQNSDNGSNKSDKTIKREHDSASEDNIPAVSTPSVSSYASMSSNSSFANSSSTSTPSKMDREDQQQSSDTEVDDIDDNGQELAYLTDGSDDVEWVGPSNWEEPSKSALNEQIPLIPIEYSSIVEAAQNFISVFEARYGPSPPFFQGSLQDAISVAFGEGCPIMERRPLAIYLHNDNAVASNLFAEHVMCGDSVSMLLKHQFVIWGWDMTQKENRQKLYEWLSAGNLAGVSGTVQSVHSSKYPLLVVLVKDHNTIIPFTVIKGHENAEQTLHILMLSLDNYMRMKNVEAVEEQNKKEREQLRQEQSEEYEKALAADRAKREEEAKKLEKEREEELEKQVAMEKRQLRKIELALALPDEPAEDEQEIIVVRVRLPDGEQKIRRFRMADALHHLVDYVASLGFESDDYNIWTSDIPKKDVSTLDLSKSFLELNWPRKEILGLTAVSWCNSIGDAIADFTVARQGFPRMGFSAAIGAPLFNLLVGFGATFSIAKLQGKTVTVAVDGVKTAMFVALGTNLISTLVLLHSMKIFAFSSVIWLLLLSVILLTSCKADEDFGDEDFVDESEPVTQTDAEISKEEYVAPTFVTPSLNKYSVHFVDWFDDLKAIGKRWLKSTAKKEGAEEAIAKYNGEWAIGSPSNIVINNDYGLIVKTKARHHAIAASLNKPFRFEGKPLVVQYEVKYEEGQECGGGYIKLLSTDPKAAFHDKTPYTIMFGPDKCGMSAKVHFILRLKNPKNGTISEYHAKQPSRSLAPFFEDKKTHLYTLIVKPNNDFQVLVDNAEIIAGNLLTDLEPSVVPPKQISDPDDKKPEDWDDREFIVDPEAKKPDDWDESAPKEVVDEDAKKPDDWLVDEEPLIPDTNAKMPEDWDESMDGTWEAPKVSNPRCKDVSGCGKWTPPMKTNPQYKGKWTPPKVSNPAYKGKWSPRLIDNPHYFEADPYKMLDPISAIGFELWTMSSGILFDNIILADDIDLVREFARQTFNIKVDQEKLYDAISNPSNIQNIWTTIKEATEERPWIWAVFVLIILIPVILISVFCFGKKSPSAASHSKKTDEPQPDEEVDEEMEEPLEEENIEANLIDQEKPETSQKVGKKSSAQAGDTKRRSRSRQRGSQSSQSSDDQAQEETQQNEPESPSKPTKRTRVRRED